MKVLMVAPQPFFEPRGTPISIYQRLNGLSTLGHEVDLVTYHIGEDVDIPGVTIHRAPRIPFINSVRIGPSWAKIPLDIVLFLQSLWLLLTKRYDVIHSHEEAALFAVIASAIFRVPHLYDMHSSLPKQLLNFGFFAHPLMVKLFEVLENWVLNTCHVVLTIGTDLEEHVLNHNSNANHIRIENIAVHNNTFHNGESIAAMKQVLGLNGKLPIVYTGTFERYQGLDLLFDSAELVVARHPDVVFVMVGGRPDQVVHWRNEVKRRQLENYVNFVGTVSLGESLKYLELAEILVSPRTEGLSVPLKIYSYLHSGKAMVATDIYAHTQILTEQTAVIADLNSDSFANAILRLVKDVDLRLQIGQQARSLAEEKYSEQNYLAKLEKAYLAVKHLTHINEISLEGRLNKQELHFG